MAGDGLGLVGLTEMVGPIEDVAVGLPDAPDVGGADDGFTDVGGADVGGADVGSTVVGGAAVMVAGGAVVIGTSGLADHVVGPAVLGRPVVGRAVVGRVEVGGAVAVADGRGLPAGTVTSGLADHDGTALVCVVGGAESSGTPASPETAGVIGDADRFVTDGSTVVEGLTVLDGSIVYDGDIPDDGMTGVVRGTPPVTEKGDSNVGTMRAYACCPDVPMVVVAA
ncbi:hypothetical protein GCM10009682_05000 [Luedemannella flava]|uniref:Uncharacterized protein n=1 Tax=Luedemannella flava TaxID=349316 RepID=A0ABN2LEG5_9ACTN